MSRRDPDLRPASWLVVSLLAPLVLAWSARDVGAVLGGRPARPAPAPDPAWARPYRVDLHRAGRGELLALPGIGPVLADRILDRLRLAPLRRVDELLEVPGVGEVVLARLRPHVMLGPR